MKAMKSMKGSEFKEECRRMWLTHWVSWRRLLPTRLQYKTLEPIFQALDVEIDEKPIPDAGQFHVSITMKAAKW